MVNIHPTIKEQLKTLRAISYGHVKRQSAGVVDMAIGMMKPHDVARALYVVCNSFAELSKNQGIIMQILKTTTEEVKQLVEDSPKMTKKEVVDKIKKITLEPDPKKA
jgi:hypothetical protein